MSLVDIYSKKFAQEGRPITVPIRIGPLPREIELDKVTKALSRAGIQVVSQAERDYPSRKEGGFLRYIEIEVRA